MRTANFKRTSAEHVKALIIALTPELGERLITTQAGLDSYGQNEGHHSGHLPDMVAKPITIVEVQRIVSAASRCNVPVIAYGAGTSLEGNAASVHGGICIDLSKMNQIVEVQTDDMLCVVGPGVTREQLNNELRSTGLFFPVDPGANATLVGMVSTRASGTTSVRYGTMRDNILALKVVLSDGTLIKTGTRARKTAAGYDLTHLFCGSEGTLGIIVEATLRLHGVSESVLSATQSFPDLKAAVQTVIATMQAGVPMARIELLDRTAIVACNAHANLALPEEPTLFIEFQGSAAAVTDQVELFESISGEFNAGTMKRATQTEERNRLWKARHNALPAARSMVPGSVTWVTDVCVPLSELADAIATVSLEIEEAGLCAPILGHVGDGNFHVFFVLKPDDKDGWKKAGVINKAMVQRAISVGGTCTGEHGVGIGKQQALFIEHGSDAIACMSRIKTALDPMNIMNPGKIFQRQETI